MLLCFRAIPRQEPPLTFERCKFSSRKHAQVRHLYTAALEASALWRFVAALLLSNYSSRRRLVRFGSVWDSRPTANSLWKISKNTVFDRAAWPKPQLKAVHRYVRKTPDGKRTRTREHGLNFKHIVLLMLIGKRLLYLRPK